MDTRTLAYIGGGVLVALIGVTLIGIPPGVWIPIGLGAAAIGIGLVIRQAQADGVDIASHVARRAATARPASADEVGEISQSSSTTGAELVRPADEAAGTTAVWLHRHGGRRVHRFVTPDGWSIQQVSTKDPDNPKKRVIGETFSYPTEDEAVAAADLLAQGVALSPTRSTTSAGRPLVAVAKV